MKQRTTFKGNPTILATFTIDDTNSGDYLNNILSLTNTTLGDGLLIANNSYDRIAVSFEESGDLKELVVLGRTKLKLNIKTTNNVIFSKLGSSNVSVSVFGR